MTPKVLLLVGSPKPTQSTSEVIGNYLLALLENHGCNTSKLHIHQILHTDGGMETLNACVQECDILILSCPLYVDSAPAAVIKAMEIIADSRREINCTRKQVMLAISNSGFPEAHHNHAALAIYKCFAKEAGFDWAGGLALGSGGAIDGKPLTNLGGMVRNVVKSLELTASALVQGNKIPAQAAALMEKPLMPGWLYLLGGQVGWYIRAIKYRTYNKLNDRPYTK